MSTALLVGAGRMGLRHLAGLRAADLAVSVVDPHAAARDAAAAVGASHTYATVEEAVAAEPTFALAVSAEPAEGRLERVRVLAGHAAALLLEKPLEQSRERTRALVEACAGLDRADCNLNLRLAPLFATLDDAGPYRMAVTGGAWGIGCNGVHYIDLALALTGSSARIAFAQLEQEPIESPRGAGYRDFGGTAAFAFEDGSRLSLDCGAGSSAPAFLTIALPQRLIAVDLHADRAIDWRRRADADEPLYRYGAGYDRTETVGVVGRDIAGITEAWARAALAGGPSALPSAAEALAAHELLFDVLETTGETHFPIT